MLFNSLPFIFGFLPIVMLVYWGIAVRHRRWRLLWLTIASYAFYGYWNYKFLPLIVGSSALDYWLGPRIAAARTQSSRRGWLAVSLVSNLGCLAFFKYYDFAAAQIDRAAAALHQPPLMALLHIAVPIGISFTAFESLSYTIDVYRGRVPPARDFLSVACFVSVFPRMIAGPIIRYATFAPQLETDPRARDRADDTVRGIWFFTAGMVKKVFIADMIGARIDPLLAPGHYAQLGAAGTWLVLIGFAYQIYFDFSGYSDMAVGLAQWLGFDLPRNFARPYRAASVQEFWHRWHITLSSWLRDYLFIPLGGSRGGEWLTIRNLMVTMLLGGLWHGANWTFLAWGAYHGAALVGHRWWRRVAAGLPSLPGTRFAGGILTFATVVGGWALFRATSLTMARTLLGSMLGLHGSGIAAARTLPIMAWTVIAAGALAAHLLPDTWDVELAPRTRLAFGLGAVTAACALTLGTATPFIYFQF